MKTSSAVWKLTALVLAVLILGMTPAAAQNSVPQNPVAGPVPGGDKATALKPAKEDQKVDRFVSLLERDGLTVQEGFLHKASLQDVCCVENPPVGADGKPVDCTWFNVASPYMAAYLPVSPGVETPVRVPFLRVEGYPNYDVAWQLRPDEAVVFVGLTPPPVRYFGFQTYRWYTFDDENGKWVRRWNNFGDQTNQLVMNTAGTPNGTKGNPFNSLTIRITTADRGIDARVREAARRAGYAPSIMNTEPIPQSLVRMGVGMDGDIFSWILRAAIPDDQDALDAYRNQEPDQEPPIVRIFRVTPNTDAPAVSPDPFPIPGFRIHGTGQTEFGLIPAVRDLRKNILAAYGNLESEEFTSEQWLFYGLHHMAVNDDGLAPSTDALYLHLKETLGPLEPDEFVIAYGVNHQQTGKAMYMNVTMYGTTKLIAADDVDDRQLAGSAADYLGAGYPDVGKLYAYKFARDCGDPAEEHCYEVPYGCCNYQGKPECVGEPCSPGMVSTEEGMLVWRSYLDPVSKTGPDPAEVVFDRAIKFSPRP
jgi:hypothetical protein